jgi:hypothetical protein
VPAINSFADLAGNDKIACIPEFGFFKNYYDKDGHIPSPQTANLTID